MRVPTLGRPRFPSPIGYAVNDDIRIPLAIEAGAKTELQFELAGPRSQLFFSPGQTRAGIVTCGGLCPGLNNVIRSLYLEMHYGYGVAEVLGFRGGYQGLDPANRDEPILLTQAFVHDIHQKGGTILGTSRGQVHIGKAVENLIRRRVNILFTVGGDGTQRGAMEIWREAYRRGYALSVVGIPKTIDNDIPYLARSFGYLTAVEEACRVLDSAHTEARSVRNGIGLVKLMGRNAGFIAAGATVASQDVNFTLVPEVPFELDGEFGFLAALKWRILERSHAVIAVAEGAGQDLVKDGQMERDASGNRKLHDIGTYLHKRIEQYFQTEGIPVTLRYFDPSYEVRSRPANCEDAILCDQYARYAVHAAMAGKTGLMIGLLHDRFLHLPIDLLAEQTQRLDPDGAPWHSVLAATGQAARFGASVNTETARTSF